MLHPKNNLSKSYNFTKQLRTKHIEYWKSYLYSIHKIKIHSSLPAFDLRNPASVCLT